MKSSALVAADVHESIFEIRGLRVMVDRDLAELYGIRTMVLNQAVKRNKKRFPKDFMFQLTKPEMQQLITNCDRFRTLRHSPTTPRVFTEQGIAMLSSVLRSEKAIQFNIHIMRAFVHLRRIALTHSELSKRVAEVEKEVTALGMKQGEQEGNIRMILGAVSKLLEAPQPKPKPRIGFRPRK